MFLPTLLSLTLVMVSHSQKMGAKINRVPSTISNSIVNLGSMDLHIHLNANQDLASLTKQVPMPEPSSFFSKPNAISEETCMCNRMKNKMLRDRDHFINNPSEILNKVLSSNDLFSPLSSSLCCDQQDQTVIIDHIVDVPAKFPLSPFPALFDTRRNSNKVFLPNGGHFPVLPPRSSALFPFDFLLPSAGQDKSNTVEIVFFPNKKSSQIAKQRPTHTHSVNQLKKKPEGIQIVGDKELRNDFKNMKVPFAPVSFVDKDKKSVKKDLNVQQKLETTTRDVIETTSQGVTRSTIATADVNTI